MKEDLLAIFQAGVRAVAPDEALKEAFAQNPALKNLYAIDRIFVVGAGKGAAPMAQALEEILKDKISGGVVVVKDGHALPLRHLTMLTASHPSPNAAGEEASRRILETAASLGPEDTLICLVTGGASALTPAPAHGLTLADLQETTNLLLASGAPIEKINALRKHLSGFGGGQLVRAANGATVIALIVSDVIGDDLTTIASGPTTPDPTTFADCLAIVKEYDLEKKLPPKVMEVLTRGEAGQIPETPKPGDAIFNKTTNILIASNAQALSACAAKAASLGFEPRLWPEPMWGEAREIAHTLANEAIAISQNLASKEKGVCLLAGGESTVTLKGKGKGGRNQEMALACALELTAHPNICALFGGTDGTDGPTDAAGGFVFYDSADRMGGVENASAFLSDNASNAALAKAGDLLVTGPTLTNVMDLAIFLIMPRQFNK